METQHTPPQFFRLYQLKARLNVSGSSIWLKTPPHGLPPM